ncbi:MAG: electron transfer flavoprotein subunit alpha/FixB family protein [Anaerolineae bacterium]|nr:electron transfer flavoprotein subunit alpha/FixB family protein [Anaerolineae bacterium]
MVQSLYGVAEETKTIWVYLERDGDTLEGVCLELLARGREMADTLGWSLEGLLLGQNISSLAHAALACGADRVYVVDHPRLADFTSEAATEAAFQAITGRRPSMFLVGVTPNGRDLAGRLAVRLRTGLNADCTDLRVNPETGVLVSEVSGFGGGILALIEMPQRRPQMATVRPGVFVPPEPDPERTGEIIFLDVDLKTTPFRTHVVERSVGEALDLTQAPVLIAGGRGVDGDFDTLRELAGLLDGEVGATRPPVDDGYVERARQIGQTGVVCRPKIAITCGVSGAFHFVVGIQDAETIIAINNDPEAPIFDYADYCIVGDVREIVPALIRELQDPRLATGNP